MSKGIVLRIPGQAVPVPEQYSIQTLIGIRKGDG